MVALGSWPHLFFSLKGLSTSLLKSVLILLNEGIQIFFSSFVLYCGSHLRIFIGLDIPFFVFFQYCLYIAIDGEAAYEGVTAFDVDVDVGQCF